MLSLLKRNRKHKLHRGRVWWISIAPNTRRGGSIETYGAAPSSLEAWAIGNCLARSTKSMVASESRQNYARYHFRSSLDTACASAAAALPRPPKKSSRNRLASSQHRFRANPAVIFQLCF
jgi:hypothetical protein